MTQVFEITQETNRISKEVLDTAFYIHTKLGPGLLESVYEECLFCLLKNKGIKVDRQKLLPIKLDDISIPSGLKLDLLVADSVIVELKAVERLLPIHEAQIHTYMKISKMPLGLLINFNVPSLKNGIKRIAMAQHQIENFV